MLKKTLILIAASVLSISLVACSTSTPNKNSSGNDKIQKEETSNRKGKVYEIEGVTVDDSGIVQTIKEVSVFDNMKDAVESYGQSALVINDENKDKVTVRGLFFE